MSIKRKRRLRSKLRFVIFILLLIGLFAGGFVAANTYLWPLLTGKGNVADTGGAKEDPIAKLPSINVLLMAVDERDGDSSQLTDTMILANINNKDNRISLLSIPRDTKVNLPRYGVNKINAAAVYGGPELAMETVSNLVGMPVDYYVLTNFNGFKGIVDALGGVTLDVEKDMYHHEKAYGGAYDINLKKGVQKLDGEHALMYVRYRSDELGDITRTQRQQKLLAAIADEVMKPQSITKLPKLIPEIQKNVETNLGLKQMIALAQAGSKLDNIQLVTQTMPGWFLDERGVSYWYVDPQNAREVARSLFEDGKVMEVVRGAMTGNTPTQVAMERTTPPAPQRVEDYTPAPVSGTNGNDDSSTGGTADNTSGATDPGGGQDGNTGAYDDGYIDVDQQTWYEAPGESNREEPGTSNHVEIIINN